MTDTQMPAELVTEFKLAWYDSPRAGRLAIVTMDNGRDYRKPNTLGMGALASLNRTLDAIAAAGDCKGLLLTGKPFVFAVGADMNMFAGVSPETVRQYAPDGHRTFKRLLDLPFPTLAAINGACIGGGLELALHCDYRAISTAAAPIAFSEVFLGILPAWGGTQLAPRLVGTEQALKTIVHNPLNMNKMMKAAEAYEAGYADRLIDAVDFPDKVVVLLEGLATGSERITRATPDDGGRDEALATARAFADDKVHGASRAPYAAIDLIEFAARGGAVEEGYRREAEAIAELLPARAAQSAIYSFHLTQQRVKKQPGRPQVEPRPVSKVAIVGAGLMGAQLGALFLQRFEVPLVLKDIDEAVLAGAREHIEEELDKRVLRGRESEGKARFLKGLVEYTTDYEPLAGSDFVLEAVVERLDVKRAILADVEAVVDPGCVLASNTSSLSITEMASELAHPERALGFHFFNPVAIMPLLEIVRAAQTSDEALATGFEVSKKLRKSGILCSDTPGFIANRLLMRFNGAAMEALEHGNRPAEIDEAITGLGLPMGPFALFDFTGVKVAFSTAETLNAAWPERFPISESFRRIAALDLPGVYDPSGDREPYEAVAEAIVVREGADKLTGDQIRQLALEAVGEECRIMLEEGVVFDARDLDTALLLGAGWPFFVGGPCKYLDETGMSEKLFGRKLVTGEDHGFAA